MSAAWRDRTPLHASSTPSSPDLISMTFPCWTAATPAIVRISTVVEATTRIKLCVSGISTTWGQGTAVKRKQTGKAKCHSHFAPPTQAMMPSVRSTTSTAINQPQRLQSGLG